MIAMIIVGILLAIASYFAWSYIHEMSHILAAKKTVGITKYELKIFPHVDPVAGWRWAACRYWMKRQPTDKEEAQISLAPRIPDSLAVIMFIFTGFMTGWPALLWGVFWGAGLVDLIVGSLGISQHSDLQRGANKLKWNPWALRISGFSGVVVSVLTAALAFFGG